MQGSGDVALLGLLGTFLAPSTGHWYRGAVVTRGMGFRALGVVAFVYGVLLPILSECEESCRPDRERLFFMGSLVLYAGGTIDDIISAPLRVRRHNQRLQQVQLAPMPTPGGMGVSLGGRF
jgi:hypothetical protein